MSVKIFADGANIEEMLKMYESGLVSGFTTNPSLMKKGGVTDYKKFSKEVLSKISEVPVSFEVFSNDLEEMYKEAKEISSWGDNVYVKIPIMTIDRKSTKDLIKKLSDENIKVNVTAIYSIEQIKETVAALNPNTKAYVSVFAGRISDAGYDHMPIMKEAVKICSEKKNALLLWASTREIYNIHQANELGVDIITVPNEMIYKYSKRGTSLEELSYQTVKTFAEDIEKLGFKIL
ncbi:transaldolase [Oceanivirga miroungae]|uniref:Transaldolase n=1 Tax=Oceanivirga miroungae TaxID=1130046 RepID=A0A6I8M834_9FUSO|nr:transaldolase [Oceanivirga miroungae]VWL85682.1 transaldolase [Oceanivirga miroungae]